MRNGGAEIYSHQPVVCFADLISQQFSSYFKPAIPYHDLLAGHSFKFIAPNKIITVGIIFIAIGTGHIQMKAIGFKLFSISFRTGIKKFACKKSHIQSAFLCIVEKIIPGKAGPDKIFTLFNFQFATIGIQTLLFSETNRNWFNVLFSVIVFALLKIAVSWWRNNSIPVKIQRIFANKKCFKLNKPVQCAAWILFIQREFKDGTTL